MPHTPGPWVQSQVNGRYIGFVRPLMIDGAAIPQHYNVCIVSERIGEAEANARLIAAAPDLLAALKALLAECEVYRAFHSQAGLLVDARNAIAKAEGTTNG